MSRAILSRLLQAVPLFFVISVLVFFISHAGGGDPITNALASTLPQESIDAIRREYGLDQPVWVQYLRWLQHLAAGDWGTSLVLRTPVYEVLGRSFTNTLILAGAAVLVCVAGGVLVGVTSGLKRGSWLDSATMFIIQVGHNFPVFWSGLLLIWIFGVQLRWLPVSGMYDMRGDHGWGDLLRHLVLPALAAAIISMLILAQLVRAQVIEIMGSEYVRTLRAQGLPRGHILRRHLGRNLLPPVVNITGLQIGYLLSGVVFVENVFNWPGIGTQLYNAAAGRDYPMIQAGVMLVTGCFIVVNLATDIILDLLNPRLRGATATA
ncbi:ABC transporter permease [Bordetella genomosp. 1]|uniref:ABC transporter permease n=1 Tax=Bordetella genomosp. 1 TaxID=1395607 RepID=A0A261SEE7_9BORD|nr:ABC transporter permease [Bordetella genomosp. 1]MDQ8033314.1 ABC transporter permease [Bordetella sp.]OZI35377.1 ABC transporter permease [Bordetella genomosp. 1]